MAFIVARPRGRWEIRESSLTSAGPRARTLASFAEISEEVVDRASRNARNPFDAAEIVRAAKRLGVPSARASADRLAEELVRCMSGGQRPRPGLRKLLLDQLGDGGVDDALSDWIGATLQERGAALVDLLGLVDRLPRKAPGRLSFPGLSRARLVP